MNDKTTKDTAMTARKKTAEPTRVSADGTQLEVGHQVISTKDNKSGEVVGLDKSDRYVRVRFTDGVVRVRSTATLKVAGRKSTSKR